MDKTCEFCKSSRPVIYCEADTANLCLSCDTKVHSANALSSRHVRTLLCERCKHRPAHVRCLGHRMFICRGCDKNLHHDLSNSLQQHHQKQKLTSYMGSPSPQDFAALWGFQLDGSDEWDHHDWSKSVFGVESDFGSSSLQSEDSSIILQQILDLKRLQLNELNNNPPLFRREEISVITLKNPAQIADQCSQHLYINNDTNQQEKSFPSPFSQLEQLVSSSHGEPFWQCKSPVRNSQLWSQNMQDLGVCEDIDSFDDFNIPEVDMTFRNYEDSFGGDDQNVNRALLLDNDFTFSSTSFDISDNGSPSASEVHRPDCVDGGVYPIIEQRCDSPDMRSGYSEGRESAMMRYKEKKKFRMTEKKNRYSFQKGGSGVYKHVKS